MRYCRNKLNDDADDDDDDFIKQRSLQVLVRMT